ncbi:glycosyltransferase [Nodularia sphaerocarpa]|uniref:glycosyltransferase n=1 Tax=Nodularia sphaerocarpa TaxID=137816 RepID=UPI001EFB2B05|nr:glycosyltransferase [Nodularia sphaerocarpa]MDB9375005.1 glycosyltransferase [Nodularia sphaerocarpa CS-585]MDB9377684.1 glycosyltransferase [Nodularia sphaerocarpa CS-585A2]ULP74201.1 D-inositol 3-phosphate glycosyltransferase [Nodularia sphaerocarpa UHCC 0038]
MKIIHLPFCFHPDPMGGTEVYVEALARELTNQGITNIIAAPANTNQSYIHNKLQIRRFAISPQVKHLKEIYGEGDQLGAIEFSKIIDEEQPDLIHLHAFTRGVSLSIVRLAKYRGIPVIFTYHTPTVSCQRGTLLQWGNQVCDGEIELSKCTACTLQGLKINKNIAQVITHLPPIVGKTLSQINLSGGIWTALQMGELVNCRFQAFQSLMLEVDHIIAVCNWVKNILIINQVPAEKITVIRQGLCQEVPQDVGKIYRNKGNNHPLRLVFFGRLDPTKGVEILIQAFMTNPQLNATLDIYGISQSTSTNDYQQKIHNLSQTDDRINLKIPVSAAKVVQTMKQYDLLAVPSQWLETGPMVVLEAFAAGVPVIGSNLGGIAELVEHNVNGVLVESSSINAWGKELQQLCDNRDKLDRLKYGISPPQMMAVVAEGMKLIYSNVLC